MSSPPAPLPISCYIRTLNEANLIGSVIAAAQQVAAEVVLVDSGSSDATIAIAEAAGARVIRQPWLGNGKQKRVGEEACAHDWLLDLDADEIVSPALAEEIRTLFASGEPSRPIYALRLVTAPPVGKPWYGIAEAERNKFYDRRKIRIPDHAAWDQFEVPAGLETGRLRAPLMHHSFRDLAHFQEKLNRVSTVRAREGGLKPFWIVAMRVLLARPFYFLKHYLTRGLWKAGLYGVAIAGLSAHGRWLRDVKMLEIHLRRKQAAREDPPR